MGLVKLWKNERRQLLGRDMVGYLVWGFFLVLVWQELAVYFGFLLKGAWTICLVGKRVSPGPRLWAMAWEAGLQMETNERSGHLARGCCVHCVLSKPSPGSCLGWEIQNRTGRWADSQKGDRGAGGEGVGVVSLHRRLVAHSSIVGGHPREQLVWNVDRARRGASEKPAPTLWPSWAGVAAVIQPLDTRVKGRPPRVARSLRFGSPWWVIEGK